MRLIKKCLVSLLCQNILFISCGIADTTSTTFQVSATIANACNVSANNLTFPTYNPLSATPSTQSSTVTVTCVLNTPYTVALNGGTTSGGTIAQRLLTDGATPTPHTLNYNLYTNVGLTTIWGDGTTGSSTQGGTGSGLAQNYTAFGQIPAGQNKGAGTYTDTVTATVTFT